MSPSADFARLLVCLIGKLKKIFILHMILHFFEITPVPFFRVITTHDFDTVVMPDWQLLHKRFRPHGRKQRPRRILGQPARRGCCNSHCGSCSICTPRNLKNIGTNALEKPFRFSRAFCFFPLYSSGKKG